jgi:hypothetical protein
VKLSPRKEETMHSPISSTLAAALFAAFAGAPAAAALPLISEVFYDASGSDDGLTFVELAGTPGGSVEGLVLEGVNGADGAVGPSLALSGVFSADGLFVVADQLGGGGTSVVGADLVAPFELQNGPDSVVLRQGASVLDAVGYGVFGAGQVFAGEGNPAADAPGGSSLARRFADVDTDDNAADFEVLALPTPGSAPRRVPEPGSLWLCALGLAALRRARP